MRVLVIEDDAETARYVVRALREAGLALGAKPHKVSMKIVLPAAITGIAEGAVARSLQHLLRARPTVVLIASTTAPAGPEDVIGRAMIRAGCQVERFLAPVEPGNLFLLSYKDDVPVMSAPGCFRSAKPNVVDLMLPPMLARYRVSGWEVACLGHGGLLA